MPPTTMFRGSDFQNHDGLDLLVAWHVLTQPITGADVRDMECSCAETLALLTAMKTCDTLRMLDISGNFMNAAGVDVLAQVVRRSPLTFLAVDNMMTTHVEELASAIGGCRTLETLLISMCAKDECLARALPQCVALTTLVLHFSDMVCMGVVQNALPKCRALTTIRLIGNALGVRRARQLGLALGQCRNLATLQLSGNKRHNNYFEEVLVHLHQCERLETVDLTNNWLLERNMVDVLLALTRCRGLRSLMLGHNHLCDGGTALVAAALARWPQLHTLRLHSNRMRDSGLLALAAAVAHCPGLQCIDVNDNLFGNVNLFGGGVSALTTALEGCPGLQHLHLADTSMGWEGMAAALQSMVHWPQLETLNVGRHTHALRLVADAAAPMVPWQSLLLHCPQLRVLRLSCNDIGVCTMRVLAEMLPRLRMLTTLDLAGNCLGDSGAEELARVMPLCALLGCVNVAANSIHDDGARAIAAAMPRCRVLETLHINGNSMTAVGEKLLVSAVARCPLLRTVRMHGVKPLGLLLTMQPWRKAAAGEQRWRRQTHALFGPQLDAVFGVCLMVLAQHGCVCPDLVEETLGRVGMYDV